ncbi:GNAT family N-acetyltransferase [Nonomuraea sp. NPDC059194]|uniref:GNAT family N-acetyltransferase n=1 Tax=Nonomuraea sp. NPDC059194 TaxID=3346764 RepID=UPI0036AD0879
MVEIRPFQPYDLPGMYRVCLQTGDSGKDATSLYHDPDLLAHIYAGPYPIADPALSFVAVDQRGVLGYIIATADTLAFEHWMEEHWWPGLRARYPRTMAADPGDGTQDWWCVQRIHDAGPTPDELYDRYPAHLHIDILPRGQGAGLGRQLMKTLLDALRVRRVPGVHLGVGAGNPGAFAFYQAMGFGVIRPDSWGSTMAKGILDV